jgi:hypothetical protein
MGRRATGMDVYNRRPQVSRPTGASTIGALLFLFSQSIFVSSARVAAFEPRHDASASTQPQAPEYDVKAAYIFNLLPFTTWPASAFESPSSPFTICVAEPDPFGASLRQTFQNEHVGGHPVVVTDISSPGAVRGCHVLFIGASADASGALEQAAAGGPVLTIGDEMRFEQRGGMITFVLEHGRVRFDVNKTSAAKVSLQFSSKVLQVARSIS